MALYVRMALYAFCAALAGLGYGELSPDGARFIINLDATTQLIVGAGGFGLTFIVSRIAKKRGGRT